MSKKKTVGSAPEAVMDKAGNSVRWKLIEI